MLAMTLLCSGWPTGRLAAHIGMTEERIEPFKLYGRFMEFCSKKGTAAG
jgi:hypothetical protein